MAQAERPREVGMRNRTAEELDADDTGATAAGIADMIETILVSDDDETMAAPAAAAAITMVASPRPPGPECDTDEVITRTCVLRCDPCGS